MKRDSTKEVQEEVNHYDFEENITVNHVHKFALHVWSPESFKREYNGQEKLILSIGVLKSSSERSSRSGSKDREDKKGGYSDKQIDKQVNLISSGYYNLSNRDGA